MIRAKQTFDGAWNLIIMQPLDYFQTLIRVHLKVGHRFNAVSKVCTDRDNIVLLKVF